MKLTTPLAALGCLLAGCATPAVHGIPEEQRMALGDEFLGEWWDSDEQEETTLIAERRANGPLAVLARFEEEDHEPVEMRLEVSSIQLADHWILDVTLAESEVEKLMETYGTLVIPAHVFFRLQGDGQSITLTSLDPDWLEGRSAEAIELLDDIPLVTAGSKELLELLTAAARDEGAWNAEWRLTRRP